MCKTMYYRPELNLTPAEVIDYLRKSQSDDPLLTVAEVLAKHESILDEWSEKNLGGKVPEENKFREVVSGETLKERPEISKVLRLIESPKYKAVKVVDPQRLTRGDLEDIGRLMKLIKHTHTLVITPERVYDLQDEYDWNAFEAELKRGNDYLKYTKKILMRGRLLSVSQGNFIGSKAPYGYRKSTVTEGRRKCPTLEINEDEAETVRLIFDLYVNQNMGYARICNHLDNLGIKSPTGARWLPTGIRDLIANEHYTGKVRWNWRKTIDVVENGEIIKTRPKSKVGEYLIFDGKHDAIIPEALFSAAREKQGKNHRAKLTSDVINPFASLVYCKCGRAMVYRAYKRTDGSEKNAPRLLCGGQTVCKTPSCIYDEFVERVCNALKEHIADFTLQMKNGENSTNAQKKKEISALERRLKEVEARELAQWEKQSDPDPTQRMPAEIFRQLNEKTVKEKENIKRALRDACAGMEEAVDCEEKIKRFQDALNALHDPNLDAVKKNLLLKSCITRIEYSREPYERMKGKGTRGRWNSSEFEIDIKFKV